MFLIGGALTGMWVDAEGSCIIVLSFGVSATFNTCGTKDEGHRSGKSIGCLSGMTTLGFSSGHSDLAVSN